MLISRRNTDDRKNRAATASTYLFFVKEADQMHANVPTESYHRPSYNCTNCLPAWHTCVRVGV